MFPSLPVPTLFQTVITTFFDDNFRFAIIMEWLVLMELIFTVSMSLSCSWLSFCTRLLTALILELLHTSLKWFILLHFFHFLSYAGQSLSLCTWPQYLYFLLVSILTGVAIFVSLYVSLSFCHIASKFFTSCKLLMTAPWALWASTLFAQINICSLGISIFSSLSVSSLMISVTISESFSLELLF